MTISRRSSPTDHLRITQLLSQRLALPQTSRLLERDFLDWKYWATTHPFVSGSRGVALEEGTALLAHAGVWPIRLATLSGTYDAFHLVDWVTQPDVRGGGKRAFRECCQGVAAAFVIGGTAAARHSLATLGFLPSNAITRLRSPLTLTHMELRALATDWRQTARWLRDAACTLYPARRLPREWSWSLVTPDAIPPALWPAASGEWAVAVRGAALIEHALRCPQIRQSTCALLKDRRGKPLAYLVLAQVGHELRLVDYGPAGLDAETARAVGLAAREIARSEFPDATVLAAATAEPSAARGLYQSGLRIRREQPIAVLPLDRESLGPVTGFRLTLLDWDAFCL